MSMGSNKIIIGVNDLQSQFPEIAAEAYGWDPSTLTAGSRQKKDWRCSNGHVYFSVVASRTTRRSGCTFCSNRKVLVGFNDLKTNFPDIAAEAYEWDPSTVIAGTDEKKRWRCNKGHFWDATVSQRTRMGTQRPIS